MYQQERDQISLNEVLSSCLDSWMECLSNHAMNFLTALADKEDWIRQSVAHDCIASGLQHLRML